MIVCLFVTLCPSTVVGTFGPGSWLPTWQALYPDTFYRSISSVVPPQPGLGMYPHSRVTERVVSHGLSPLLSGVGSLHWWRLYNR